MYLAEQKFTCIQVGARFTTSRTTGKNSIRPNAAN